MIFVFPSILLKQSNRSFLNSLALNNIEVIKGTGGGNYIKEVYKDFLLGLDEDELLERFNIIYSKEDRNVKQPIALQGVSQPAEGYLKLKFDYKDGILPRSIISFHYSQNGKSGSVFTFVGDSKKTSRLFLTKPTFFATIMLNVFKTLLIALRNTQIELFNIVVISECFRITFHNYTSIF